MNKLVSFASRLPAGILSLALAFSVLLSSCGSGRRADGSLTIAGVLYLILAVLAFLSLIKQDWSTGKKIIWGLIIWFFPFGGSIIYFLFSGRN
ncbi:MAG: PLDc_N domain-containing protein [Hymenobacter sp.]|nr:PLDc_N domain-containing protein [Hymenobacter sp.]